MDALEDRRRGPKIIRPPNTRRARERERELIVPLSEKVKLERVLGLTTNSNAAVAQDKNSGCIAYAAGCIIVLFNPLKGFAGSPNTKIVSPGKNRQWRYLTSSSKKTITCLTFSRDGRHLASGECGHGPCVRVWDIGQRAEIASFSGHHFGVNCVAFSPDQKYLVSVGAQHDQIVNVWDWRGKAKVASNKVSTKVKAVDFAENGSYFVTVGHRHVKFWYLDYPRGGKKFKETVPLMGRSAILGQQSNNYFVDVGCGVGDCGDTTFAITKSGLLCEFNNRRLLDRWVELRTPCANALSVGAESVFIGCADGIVRCFDPVTLEFKLTLPRTHYLGVDVAKGLSINHMVTQPAEARYPDCIAVKYDEVHERVACVYNDHSIYIWDVTDKVHVGKSHSFLFHSSCIWGIEGYPAVGDGVKALLPFGTFFTCSSDDTIRIWNLDPKMPNNTLYKRNVYSNDLLKVLYIDPKLTHLCDKNASVYGSPDKNGSESSFDTSNGVRCLRISHDGKHLASGDRAGNIRVHEMQFMDEVVHIEAHDSEVLALEYSRPESPVGSETKPRSYLASASRDRLIHVFGVHKEYDCAQTISDHSSSITAVRFVQQPSSRTLLMSCGADKSIIFREADDAEADRNVEFGRYHNVTGKNSLYDMEVDISGQYLLTACQDRCVRVYALPTGKHTRTFRGSNAEEGTLIEITLDPSGMYLATSSTDKTLCIFDYCTEELLATMSGHAEIVTGLLFSADCRHLISVSGDGCIFVWRLPTDMTRAMLSRLAQLPNRRSTPFSSLSTRSSLSPAGDIFESSNRNGFSRDDESSNYKFNVGDQYLPSWAKKQIGTSNAPGLRAARSEFHVNGDGNGNARGLELPKGRWAQRIDNSQSQSLTVRSHHFSDTSIPFPTAPTGPNDSESSKDSSSLDSTTGPGNFARPSDSRGKVPTLGLRRAGDDNRNRHLTDDSSVNSFPLEEGETEHEGDIDEDFSETEDSAEELGVNAATLYVPQNMDGNVEFTVNEMDQEELKNSRRRHRKNRPSDISNLMSTSVSGSQESDLDVDEEIAERLERHREDPSHSTTPSTPTADPSERNNIHGLSVSTESIDQLGQREVYMLRNYDSLNERRMSSELQKQSSSEGGKSISSKFYASPLSRDESTNGGFQINSSRRLSGSTIKNAESIEAVLEPQREGLKNRLELRKQIEESRRKLESVGYSGLRGSKSISDLSRVPDSDVESSGAPSLQSSAAGMPNGAAGSGARGIRDSGALRRACSLSDLASPSSPPRRILPSPPSHGKVKKPSSKGSRAEEDGNLQRAPSMGTLSGVGGNFLKGTLSSNLKARGGNGVQAVSGSRRRIQNQGMSASQSIGDLRYRRVPDDDSSSEENAMSGKRAQGLTGRRAMGGSERDLNVAARDASDPRFAAPAARGGNPVRPSKQGASRRGLVAREQCAKLGKKLGDAVDHVMELQRKVAADGSLSEAEKRDAVQSLGEAAIEAHNKLGVFISGYLGEGGGAVIPSGSRVPVGPMPPFPMPGGLPSGNPVMIQFMQQFVSFMQQQPGAAVGTFPGVGFSDAVAISSLHASRSDAE